MQSSDSEASSSHAIHTVDAESLPHDPSNSKTTLQNFDIEYAGVERPAQRGNRWSTLIHQQSSRHPRISNIVKWLRGPRPKVDLPGMHPHVADENDQFSISLDPKPLLDIDINVRGRRIVVPIESTWLRLTRLVPNNWLLLILGAGYIVSFAFFARAQFFQTPADSFIGCTSTYWLAENGCGLDGQSCAPFNDSSLE
jgi:hypothetical protein